MFRTGYIVLILTAMFWLVSPKVTHAQNPVDKLLEALNIINMTYVDSVDNQKLTESAIVSMLAELDPHSVYIPKDEVREMNESLSGSFEGIGIQFNMIEDTVVVITTIAGGPAERLGIISGDRLIAAEDHIISGTGTTEDEIIKLLRGKKGSQVKLTVVKPGVDHEVEYLITREKIPISSVDAAYMLDNNTGYIKINRFSMTTYDEFSDALKQLEKRGMNDLVLDLRGNGGGYLYAATQIADDFIAGDQTLVMTKSEKEGNHVYESTKSGGFESGKLVLIIDEGSASASEILAGAMQDLDRALIIGRRSFGKGLVMKSYTLSDGSVIRITTSRYYTPSGRSIQKDYGSTKEEYDREVARRFERGEFYSSDSIHLTDSLKYKTAAGRPVYGGGGIVPDVFVPVDSDITNKDFQTLLREGAFTGFAVMYADHHRKTLLGTFMDPHHFALDTVMDTSLINAFSAYLAKENITKDGINAEIRTLVLHYIKAYLARNLWNSQAYFIVLNEGSAEIGKALELMHSDESPWDKLSIKSE